MNEFLYNAIFKIGLYQERLFTNSEIIVHWWDKWKKLTSFFSISILLSSYIICVCQRKVLLPNTKIYDYTINKISAWFHICLWIHGEKPVQNAFASSSFGMYITLPHTLCCCWLFWVKFRLTPIYFQSYSLHPHPHTKDTTIRFIAIYCLVPLYNFLFQVLVENTEPWHITWNRIFSILYKIL